MKVKKCVSDEASYYRNKRIYSINDRTITDTHDESKGKFPPNEYISRYMLCINSCMRTNDYTE